MSEVLKFFLIIAVCVNALFTAGCAQWLEQDTVLLKKLIEMQDLR